MAQPNRFAPFIVLVLLFVILQAGLVAADLQQTPAGVAKSFAIDYFNLDPAMGDNLCQALTGDEETDIVDDFLYAKKMEGQAMGRPMSFMKHQLYDIHLAKVNEDDNGVTYHLSGLTRVNIHPAFTIVARTFRLGKTYEVDEEIEVIREDGKWRVCGHPFGLAPEN